MSEMTCNDPVLIPFFIILKNGIDVLSLLVPIVLIVMSVYRLSKMVMSGEDFLHYDAKGAQDGKKLRNSWIAAIAFFLLPHFLTLLTSAFLTQLNFSKDIANCWQSTSSLWSNVYNEEEVENPDKDNIVCYRIPQQGIVDNYGERIKEWKDNCCSVDSNQYNSQQQKAIEQAQNNLC